MPSSKNPQPKPTPKPNAASLPFERKNQDMVKLPKYARINKRPIPHAPISSPYAGPSIPKTIYVSSSTPYMSAVKRVQKLLRQAEKRATASIASKTKNQKGVPQKKTQGGKGQEDKLLAALAKGEERDQLAAEEILVKATGRAMDTALKVGRWFQHESRKAEFGVRVSTGAVMVVDDVEEDENGRERFLKEAEMGNAGDDAKAVGEVKAAAPAAGANADETTVLTTTTGAGEGDTTIMTSKPDDTTLKTTSPSPAQTLSKSALRKRKRAAGLAASLAETELPESRTRWVNSVEIAVSLK